jgi:Delta3-Delta2-enoyl-CoA isomerase
MWTSINIDQIKAFLDQVEASKGPAVLVAFGTGATKFSTGFDLNWQLQVDSRFYDSNMKLVALIARIISLNVPTLVAMNGHAYAGGLLFSLGFDFRIMKQEKARVCLYEIQIGLPLTTTLSALCVA